MKNNKKGFANVVLIGAVVALVAIGGYFIMSRKSQPASETKADTGIYVDNTLGFSIVPPKGWYTNTKEMPGSSVAFFEKDGGQIVNKQFNPTLAISYWLDDKSDLEQNVAKIKKVYSNASFAGVSEEYKPISDNVVVIDGHNARVIESSLTTTITISNSIEMENCIKCKFKLRKLDVLMADGKGKIYYLAATALESDWAKYKDLITNSQKTFKFTNPVAQDETANWKTFTNTENGFEFRYPTNLTYKEEKNGAFSALHFTQANNEKLGFTFVIKNVDTGYGEGCDNVKKTTPTINNIKMDREDFCGSVIYFIKSFTAINNGLDVKLFDQVLSTFKFTNPTTQTNNSNWKDQTLNQFKNLTSWNIKDNQTDWSYVNLDSNLLNKYGNSNKITLNKGFNDTGWNTAGDEQKSVDAQNALLSSVKKALLKNGWKLVASPTEASFYMDYLYDKDGHPLILSTGSRDAVTGGMYISIQFQY